MATRSYILPSRRIVELDAALSREDAFAVLREQYPEEFPEPKSTDREGLASRVGKGLAQGAVGLGAMATEGLVGLLPDDMEAPFLDRTRPFFKDLQKSLDPSEQYRGGITQQLSSAAGSILPFLPLAFAGGPLGLAAGVGLGALSGAGDARTRAAEAGEEQDAVRTGLGALLGATQFVGPSRMAARLRQPVAKGVEEIAENLLRRWGPSTAQMFKQRAKDILAAGVDNATMAAVYNLGQNMLEGGYNPERGLTDGLVEDATLEGAVGSGLQALIGGRHARRMNQLSRDYEALKNAPPPAPATPAPAPAAAQPPATAGGTVQPARVLAERPIHDAEGNELLAPRPWETPITDETLTAFEGADIAAIEAAAREANAEAQRLLSAGDRAGASAMLRRSVELRNLTRQRWQEASGLTPTSTPEQWLRWFADNPEQMPEGSRQDPQKLLAEIEDIDRKLADLTTKREKSGLTPNQARAFRFLRSKRNKLVGHTTKGLSTWDTFLRDEGIAHPEVRRQLADTEKAAAKAAKEAEKAAKVAEREAKKAARKPPVEETVTPAVPAQPAPVVAPPAEAAVSSEAPAQAVSPRSESVESAESATPAEAVTPEAPVPVEDPTMPTDTDDGPQTGELAQAAVDAGVRVGDVPVEALSPEFAALRANTEAAEAALTESLMGGDPDAHAARTRELEALLDSARGMANIPMEIVERLNRAADTLENIGYREVGDVDAGEVDAGDAGGGAVDPGAGDGAGVPVRRAVLPAARAGAPVEGAVDGAGAVPVGAEGGEGTGNRPLVAVPDAIRRKLNGEVAEPVTFADVADTLPGRYELEPFRELLTNLRTDKEGRQRAVTKSSINRYVADSLDALIENPATRAEGERVKRLLEHVTGAKGQARSRERQQRSDSTNAAKADDRATAKGMQSVAAFVNDVIAQSGRPGIRVEMATEPTAEFVRKGEAELRNLNKQIDKIEEDPDVPMARKINLISKRNALRAELDIVKDTGYIDPKKREIAQLGQNLGINIVFVRPAPDNKGVFDGFTLRGINRNHRDIDSPHFAEARKHIEGFEETVFLNEKTKKPLMSIFGHEYLHSIRTRAPAEFAKFREAFSDYILNDRPKSKLEQRQYDAAQKEFLSKMGEGMTLEDLRRVLDPTTDASRVMTDAQALDLELRLEDAMADTVGERMADPRFWESIQKHDVAGNLFGPDNPAPSPREGAGPTLSNVFGTATRLLDRFKQAFLGARRSKPLTQELRQLDGAIKHLFEETSNIEVLTDPYVTQGAQRQAAPDTPMGQALGAAGVTPGFDPVRAADEIRTVLFAGVSDPVQRQTAKDLITRAGPLANMPTDPGRLISADTARAVLPMIKHRSMSDYINAMRVAVSNHAAHLEGRYGGQHTYKGFGDVMSTLNGLGRLFQAMASGEITATSWNRGHLDIDNFGNAVVRDGDSMGKIQEDVRALSSKYGMDPNLMTSVLSAYLYGNRIKEVRKTYERKMAAFEEAVRRGMSRDSHPMRAEIDQIEAWLAKFDREGWADAGIEAGAKYPELVNIGQRIREQTNHVVDLLLKTGRITPDKAASWRSTGGYVPMFTDKTTADHFDAMLSAAATPSRSSRRARIDAGGLLPELSGDALDGNVTDIFANIERLMHWGHVQALNNDAARTLIKESAVWNDGVPLQPKESDFGIPPEVKISAYENGKKVYYQANDPLAAAAFHGIRTSTAWKGFQAISNVLRKTVTLAPGFSLGQLPQDAIRAAMLSGVDRPFMTMRKVFSSFTREMANAGFGAERSPVARDLAEAGITPEVDFREDAIGKLSSMASASRFGVLGRMYHLSDRMAKASDYAQRAAVYETTLRDNPGDVTLARVRAREVINFRRAGNSQRIANLRTVVPFLNAFIQGMEVLGKALFRGQQQQANLGAEARSISPRDRHRNLARFWGLAAKMGVFMTLYASLMAGDEEYERMAEWERDRFFLIPGTKGVIGEDSLRIPIPQEVGFLFKAIPERLFRYIAQNGFADGQTGTEFLKGLGGAMARGYSSPNLIPQAYRVPLELIVNHSFFLGQPIEGWGMQNLNKSQRYSSNTSELAKLVSQFLSSDTSNMGLSPVQVDYAIRGTFGMLGTALTSMSDVVLGSKPTSTPDQMARALTLGAFVSPQNRRGVMEQYYNLRDEVDRAYGTVQKLYQRGGEQAARPVFDELRNHLANRGAFNQLDKVISNTRRYKQGIERQIAEGRITPDEGRERIRRMDRKLEDHLARVMPNLLRNARAAP